MKIAFPAVPSSSRRTDPIHLLNVRLPDGWWASVSGEDLLLERPDGNTVTAIDPVLASRHPEGVPLSDALRAAMDYVRGYESQGEGDAAPTRVKSAASERAGGVLFG